jgi:hypothetical protein
MRTTIYLALLTLAVWQGYTYLAAHSHLLDAKEQHLLILYFGIALVVSWIIGGAIRDAAKLQISREQYHNKVQLYENFTALWYELLDHPATQENADLMVEFDTGAFKARLALHGSQEVIEQFNRFTAQLEKTSIVNPLTRTAFDALILAMRKDIGQNAGYFSQKAIKQLLLPSNS